MIGSSHLRSTHVKAAITAGVGLAVIGCYLYYNYRRRKVLQTKEDEGETDDSLQKRKAKERLKSLLRVSNVFIRDLDAVEDVIDGLMVGGASKLQVIADFDRTLSAVKYAGNSVPSCHKVLEGSPQLPDWFRENTEKMRDYYLGIEVNPSMSRDEKYPFMVEWWTKAHDLLVNCSLRKEAVSAAVAQSNLYLREGADKSLRLLHDFNIPLLIFSAGIGDVIEECLVQRYSLHDNIKIVSNWLDFNHAGVLVGFKGELIHVYNKNLHAIEHSSYFDDIKQRHNIILLGDSLGDLDMVNGVVDQENLLTIGFLNQHVRESLPEYMAVYDIVLAEEATLDLLYSLLENILA